MTAIFKRDFRAYFTSPIGYVFVASFLLVLNIYFYLINVYSASAAIENTFSFIITMLVFLVPVLTMRTFSEDYKQKTDQLLLTAPVRLTGIVVGKFLAAFGVFVLAMLFTLIYVIVIAMFGTPNAAMIVGNYVAILGVACAYISIGLFISSLTENQLVSCVATLGAFLFLYLVDYMYSYINVTWIQNLIYWFSMFRRYNTFTQGIFSLSDFLFYISVAATFIFLTVRVLEKKRWS